ncbi:MAG: sporulation protein YqfD [Lachnospiraceae bacterium]|nr:sporulation protein YqfD [Lachnospiraceae bacterium]
MIHKIIGWLFGYVTMRLRGEELERFVNMCRHKGMILWQMYWSKDKKEIYANISLKNFWKLRSLARKTHVVPLVVERHGGPFIVQKMRRRASFFVGLVLFLGLVLFFSTRIWGITFYGERYHTKESLLVYLEQNGVYGGVSAKAISCAKLEDSIRKGYQDIGWVSAEKRGSKLFVRLQEVKLIEQQEEKDTAPASLVASQSGKVISIVTREGTAKVHAGDTVKKGDVLISGKVEIVGDSGEVMETRFVRAGGTVVVESKKEYRNELPVTYEKKRYTGNEKQIYSVSFEDKSFFWHNPLNRLETEKKYDIIAEDGRLCPDLSLRFPLYWKITTYRQVDYEKKTYTRREAVERLEIKHWEYLKKKEDAGYRIRKTKPKIRKLKNSYLLEDTITWRRNQEKYRKISQESIQKYKQKQKEENETNGNHGDNH